MNELHHQLESAVLRRNPGYAQALQPPLAAEHVRQELKRLGLKENVDPIVQWYAWHNGTRFARECDASRLGIAPPVVSAPDAKNLAFLESLGHKITVPQKIYDPVAFHDFEGGVRSVKLWKKFARTNPACAALAGRFFPILARTKAGEDVAIDVSADGHGRVVTIAADRQVREAYPSFEAFLRDLIRANETDELLACIKTPGPVLALEPLAPPTATKARARAGAATLPATGKTPIVRTDFSDDAAWDALWAELSTPADELAADLEFVSDRAFAGVTPETFRSFLPPDGEISHGFLVDRAALTQPDHPVLAVDLSKRKPRTFRVAAAALAEVDGNLSLGNMGFAEFLTALDPDGVFRGSAPPAE
jgi:hypothetical protein